MTQAILNQQQQGGFTLLSPPAPFLGNQWFVNSATGTDDTQHGFTPQAPLKTMAYALGTAAIANNGDVVYVAPGHTETIAAAGGITMSVAGVTVIGLGYGRSRPTIKYSTANTAMFLISAASCCIQNLVFDCTGFAAIAAPLSVTAADFSVLGCEFITANSTNQAVAAIVTTAAGTRMTVQSSVFRGTNNAGNTAAIIIVGGDGHIIGGPGEAQGNFFIGAYTSGVGAIQNVTTACTNTLVANNVIQNVTAGCTKAMVFVGTSTGQISNNAMQILSGTAPITGAAMSWIGYNSYAATIATGTTLV